MSLGQSIRRGIMWTFAGNAGTQVLNFAVGIVLARVLAPSDFGIIATIGIFTGIAGFIAGGGIGDALVRADDVAKLDYDIAFTMQLLVGFSIFAFFFVTAPAIAAWYDAPAYSAVLRVSALSFLMRPFIMTPTSVLYREMRFKPLTAINLAVLGASSCVSIGLAYAGHGVWSLLLGGIAGSCVNIALLVLVTRWRPSLSRDYARGRRLARYGALSSLGNFLVHLRNQASLFIVSRTLDAHALGLFNKSNQFSQIPHSLVTGPVYQVTFRALASTSDNRDLNQYLYLRSITLVMLYAVPPFVAMIWMAEPIIRILYGEKWADCAPLLVYFAAFGPLLAMESLAGCVLAARDWLGREMLVQIAQLGVVSLGTVAGIPYGLEGMCAGVCLAALYGCVHLSWLASCCLNLPVRKIIAAPLVPLCYGLALLALWAGLDHQLHLRDSLPTPAYVAVLLAAGAVLYLGLFLCWPAPALAAERARWLKLVRVAPSSTVASPDQELPP